MAMHYVFGALEAPHYFMLLLLVCVLMVIGGAVYDKMGLGKSKRKSRRGKSKVDDDEQETDSGDEVADVHDEDQLKPDETDSAEDKNG